MTTTTTTYKDAMTMLIAQAERKGIADQHDYPCIKDDDTDCTYHGWSPYDYEIRYAWQTLVDEGVKVLDGIHVACLLAEYGDDEEDRFPSSADLTDFCDTCCRMVDEGNGFCPSGIYWEA